MELMDVLRTRRSVRAYTDAPVARETLEALLQTAVLAPTGMNAQPWAFGVITGAERLREYSDRTKAYLLEQLDQLPMLERYRDYFANPQSNIFHGAPAVITVFAKPQGVSAESDCTMAAYNMMLAACAQGLGTCWIGFFVIMLHRQPELKRELGVPEDYRPVAVLAIGHPRAAMPPVQKAAPEIMFWQE